MAERRSYGNSQILRLCNAVAVNGDNAFYKRQTSRKSVVHSLAGLCVEHHKARINGSFALPYLNARKGAEELLFAACGIFGAYALQRDQLGRAERFRHRGDLVTSVAINGYPGVADAESYHDYLDAADYLLGTFKHEAVIRAHKRLALAAVYDNVIHS